MSIMEVIISVNWLPY